MKIAIVSLVGVVAITAGVWYWLSTNPEVATNATSDTTAPLENESDAPSETVATVNEEAIVRADFDAVKSQVVTQQNIDVTTLDTEAENQIDTQIINELIARTLLEQAVAESDVTVAPEEIDAQLDATITQLGGQAAFEELLAAEGVSEEMLREQIGTELATQTYIAQAVDLSAITVTDEEIESAYEHIAAQEANVPPLAEVRPQVEQSIVQQKQQALTQDLIAELRAAADIEVLL